LIRRYRVAIASATVVIAAAASLIAYALANPGYRVHHADLNDGGIWVTNDSVALFGRLNKPINQLDGAIPTATAQSRATLDVRQDGAAVLALDENQNVVYPLDGSQLRSLAKGQIHVSSDTVVAMGGGVVAVLDKTTGVFRATTYDPDSGLFDISALDTTGHNIAPAVGANSNLVVGLDGTIYLASPAKGLVTVRHRGTTFEPVQTRSLGPISGTVQITVAGDAAVVLVTPSGSPSSTALLPDGKSVSVPVTSDAKVQQAGPATADILVADSRGVWSVPLRGGSAQQISDQGTGVPAAPVQLRGCRFAAWSGSPGEFAGSCAAGALHAVPLNTSVSHGVVFRVNHKQVMLNDPENGNTWNLDNLGAPDPVANWNAVEQPKPSKQPPQKNPNPLEQKQALKPKANDATLGARPGRTTALYVLDFATDPAGQGMAVDNVVADDAAQQSWYSIAPDGQVVDVALPPATATNSGFRYTVRTPAGNTATAHITLRVRQPSENTAPGRRNGWDGQDKPWNVPESGKVSIPVLQNWRDYADGDPVVLASATVEGAAGTDGSVAVTPDGELLYGAPATSGTRTIKYAVTDGYFDPASGQIDSVTGEVKVSVQDVNARAVAAEAEPDYVRTTLGATVDVQPLSNDLPGLDPLQPFAEMRLVPVHPHDGAIVTTDVTNGTVTITPSHTGTTSLDYQVAYGDAPYGNGTITVRVDPPSTNAVPIAAPDVAVVHGQAPTNVDVLANDSDPSGNLLVVQSATPDNVEQLAATVVDGHFVEIVPQQATLSPNTQTVKYTITDGVTAPVTGSITVTQLPPPDDTPITVPDHAVVRAGQSVVIPVLDNDISPAGDQLSLAPSVQGSPAAGQLPVDPTLGSAYVSGRVVRYVAPPSVNVLTPVTITYVARNTEGGSQIGTAVVDVTPLPSPTNVNKPPVPPTVDARTVAGDTITIRIPTTGVDPDGDAVVVTGIGSAARLGRVLGFGPDSIQYQSYPQANVGGTDRFEYTVRDTQGASATGTIRIAVVQPSDPPHPVAVDDLVTVAPGATVRVNVLANDFIADPAATTIEDLNKTNGDLSGVTLVGKNTIQVVASRNPKYDVLVHYTITDGVQPSSAYLRVQSRAGADLPPVALDKYAAPKVGATTVTVNLLQGNSDPDSNDALTVVVPGQNVAPDGTYSIAVKPFPQAIPYVIRDSANGTAAATVYVPAIGSGVPYAKPNARIVINPKQSETINLADYLVDPSGKVVRTTTKNAMSSSPGSVLSIAPGKNDTTLSLSAPGSYQGPAAITFQVTDAASVSAPDAQLAYVTIPVDIGDLPPVLRCPSTPLEVAEGAVRPIPVASLCHVWTSDPGQVSTLSFSGRITGISNVSVSGSGPVLEIKAVAGAKPGATGQLTLSVDNTGAKSETIPVTVLAARRPLIDPIVLDSLDAGRSYIVDIQHYVHSFIDGPVSIVSQPAKTSGDPADITYSKTTVSVHPLGDSKGTITFKIVVTDEPDLSRPDHYVTGQIVLHVLGHPDAPTGVAARKTVKSNEVDLYWTAPKDNGSAILENDVTITQVGGHGGVVKKCGPTPSCNIYDPATLKNGQNYTLTVIAINAVGPSKPSDPSAPVMPNHVPGQVPTLVPSKPGDRTLTLTWTKPTGDFSPITSYRITWGNGGSKSLGPDQLTTDVNVASNDEQYMFTIVAINSLGAGPPLTVPGQSGYYPAAVPVNSVPAEQTTTAQSTTAASVTWGDDPDPNGPAIVEYKVYRQRGAAMPGATDGTEIASFSGASVNQREYVDANIQNDGTKYWYTVTATNGANYESAKTNWQPFVAIGKPDPVSSLSATDHDSQGHGFDTRVQVTFDLGAANGAGIYQVDYTMGSVSGSWAIPTGTTGQVTEYAAGLTNGTTYNSVTVVEYNRDAQGVNNPAGSDPRTFTISVNPFGPVKSFGLSAGPYGSKIQYNVTVDPNGRAASVHVTGTGINDSFTTASVGLVSHQGYSSDIGFRVPVTVTATAQNASMSAPATVSQSTSTSNPTVSVNPGASVPANDPSYPYCTSAGCYVIVVQVTGLTPGATYTLWYGTSCTTCQGSHPCPSGPLTGNYYACTVTTADANGNITDTSRAFGYAGKDVFVDVNKDTSIHGSYGSWP
jgi:hypothetical protein